MARPLPSSPEADRVQIELIRRATPTARLALACSLTSTTTSLARQAIRRRMPSANERHFEIEFVAVHFGRRLADRVAAYLSQRDP